MFRFVFLTNLVTALIIFTTPPSFSQHRKELHVFAGISNYQGDLQPQAISTTNIGRAFGISFKYGLNEKFFIRGGFSSGQIAGDDKKNRPELQIRNLSFQSQISDLNLGLEYRLFKPENKKVTPYIFAGVGGFSFNPYVKYGDKNEKVYLQPLGTEGQGLPEYPDRKMYKLTQVSIPLGGGLLWQATEKMMIGLELRQNITFTDYLDDVSTKYALEGPLLRDRGPLAVELAWRRDEYDGTPYPTNQSKRGDPQFNDWFYYVGLTVGFRLPGGSGGGRYAYPGTKSQMKQLSCPKM